MQDSLGDRMKEYENCYRIYIPRRSYVIIRIDGKSFHTYTRNCKKPFDENLNNSFCNATLSACSQIQNCKFAYHQSDEISFVLTDFETIKTDAWFGNNIQKMVSIASSIFTAEFNRNELINSIGTGTGRLLNVESISSWKMGEFDARVFLLPNYDEVINYLIWRQNDASKNSVQSLARTYFSHKELQNKNNSDLNEILFQKGINWNDLPTQQKRGEGFYKIEVDIPTENGIVKRSKWRCDLEIPIFSEDKEWFKNKIPNNK